MELIKTIGDKEYVLVEKENYHDMTHFIQTVCKLHGQKKCWDKTLEDICKKWIRSPDA